MMKKILFEDACILNAIKLGRFFVRSFSPSVSLAGARLIGSAVYFLSARGRIARKNVRMVFASEKSETEIRRIARQSVENLAMSAVDLLRVPEMSERDLESNFTIVGKDDIKPYVERGQGLIFLTGHFGSWELLNIVSGLLGYPFVALARVQKHPRSDQYLNELRRSKGSEVVHKGMPIREILHALKKGKIVGILNDQDGGRQGRLVEFMGRLSSTPAGAAAFALRTGALIVPAFICRQNHGKHRIDIEQPLEHPPLDWPSEKAETFLLQQFAKRLEKHVRQEPGQWLWAHRRWKTSPDKRILILSDGKAGHANQSLAVLEAIRRDRSVHHHMPERIQSTVVELRFRSHFRSKMLSYLNGLFRGHLPGLGSWVRWALDPAILEALEKTYADVVISCGSSTVSVNLWAKRLNDAKSVVVMKPSIPYAHFDAVIAPRHDEIKSHPSVFTTEGALSWLRKEDLEVEGATLSAELSLNPAVKRIGVLIGGDTSSLKFEPESFGLLVNALKDFCVSRHAEVLITTSRRTPAWADARLKEAFSDRRICPMLLVANEGNRKNVVAGILGCCDAMVVTAESMSMISEAVFSGKPVVAVKPWSGSTAKKKYDLYLNRLDKQGRVALVATGEIQDYLNRAIAGEWTTSDDYHFIEEAILSGAAKKVIR